jgi:hypothetical protein
MTDKGDSTKCGPDSPLPNPPPKIRHLQVDRLLWMKKANDQSAAMNLTVLRNAKNEIICSVLPKPISSPRMLEAHLKMASDIETI